MEMSVLEFAELQNLSDEGRRARLDLPDGCTPGISAMRPAAMSAQRLIVLIDCKAPEPAQEDPKVIRWSPDTLDAPHATDRLSLATRLRSAGASYHSTSAASSF